mmetsp:Transcript_10532/g.33326  ORF Transcript_10532/g.33326 Transcript_10532/m.33326 type:complete len:188 (-) Transcript_10532:406-969(-)
MALERLQGIVPPPRAEPAEPAAEAEEGGGGGGLETGLRAFLSVKALGENVTRAWAPTQARTQAWGENVGRAMEERHAQLGAELARIRARGANKATERAAAAEAIAAADAGRRLRENSVGTAGTSAGAAAAVDLAAALAPRTSSGAAATARVEAEELTAQATACFKQERFARAQGGVPWPHTPRLGAS